MASTTVPDRLLREEEFLALPDDANVERVLVHGRVIEVPPTRPSWTHSTVEFNTVELLKQWRAACQSGAFRIGSGAAGGHPRRKPDTVVGSDVAVFPENAAPKAGDKGTLLPCPPPRAVEVVSRSEMLDLVQETIEDYLSADVPLVSIVDPHFRTVMVCRPDAEPEMFSGDEERIGDPHLPGLKDPVKEVFADM